MIRFFFSMEGRVARGAYIAGTFLVGLLFALGFVLLDDLFGRAATWVLYPFTYMALLALAIRRAHDLNASGIFLAWALVPVIGLLYVLASLVFRRGTQAENAYGPEPTYHGLDHYRVPDPRGATPSNPIIDDVTQMNAVAVTAAVAPTSLDELVEVVKRSNAPISIGGGRFSMGGQTASPGSLHIDMRRMNRVISLSPTARTIHVQAGIRWCDVQRFIDTHDLSVKIMQTYANFTVGGSLSVNCHGRYVGLGPVILSVRAITLVLANGETRRATPTENAELFYGAIGGYGALGIIAEAELDLEQNTRVERVTETLPAARYLEHFKQKVRSSPGAIFHNADLYPPSYGSLRSVTWQKTDRFVTRPERIMRVEPSYLVSRYLFWTVSEMPFGAFRRRRLFEPLFYAGARPVHWRNYEAGYDVAELEPTTRTRSSFVLLEYFVPIARFDEFVPKMAEIFRRFSVNVLNVSVRHALPDSGSLLAWAREEVFAFVVYYKQAVDPAARAEVGVWTRALIDAAIETGGSYYLPYQPHATPEQFHRAYPRANELFALKKALDPEYRLRNVLWDTYYAPTLAAPSDPVANPSEFHAVYDDVSGRDRFYLFLQNVYRLFPEGKFHQLIREATETLKDDEAIYRHVQERLPGIAPALAPVRYALPALAKQKQEMARQTRELLGDRRGFDGYLEIGGPGRYVKSLRSALGLRGPVYLIGETIPGSSPVDIVERGGLAKAGAAFALDDYAAIDEARIPSGSLDLVTCYIGLHHVPRAKLDDFIRSIVRVLRKGGVFVLRDHDAGTKEMKTFASLVHTVFNAGLFAPWSVDRAELRFFTGVDEIAGIVASHGLRDSGKRLFQAHDPSLNALMAFEKV